MWLLVWGIHRTHHSMVAGRHTSTYVKKQKQLHLKPCWTVSWLVGWSGERSEKPASDPSVHTAPCPFPCSSQHPTSRQRPTPCCLSTSGQWERLRTGGGGGAGQARPKCPELEGHAYAWWALPCMQVAVAQDAYSVDSWGLDRLDQVNLPLNGEYNPGYLSGSGTHGGGSVCVCVCVWRVRRSGREGGGASDLMGSGPPRGTPPGKC